MQNLLKVIQGKPGNVCDRPVLLHFSTDEVYGDIKNNLIGVEINTEYTSKNLSNNGIYIDLSNNRIGINTINPLYSIDIYYLINEWHFA